MKTQTQLWFHGTDRRGYKAIKKSGLATHSYITPDLMVALTMGGPYVFMFYAPIPKRGEWQRRTTSVITEFAAILKYHDKLMYFNREQAIAAHRQKHIEESGSVCNRCNGYGELNYPVDGHDLRISGSRFGRNPYQHRVAICPDCNGYGTIKKA